MKEVFSECSLFKMRSKIQSNQSQKGFLLTSCRVLSDETERGTPGLHIGQVGDLSFLKTGEYTPSVPEYLLKTVQAYYYQPKVVGRFGLHYILTHRRD